MASSFKVALLLFFLTPLMHAESIVLHEITTKGPIKIGGVAKIENWNHYEILIPQIFRPGSTYKFSFTTFTDKAKYFNSEVGIKNNKGEILVKKPYKLLSDRTYSLNLNIPAVVPQASYEFFFESQSFLKIKVSKQITINKKVHSLFIQTDKGLYKPGQKMLFRVLAIKPDLKAYKDAINITIYDTAQNKIKEMKDQKNNKGVITSELQLSDITPLGKWKIKAQTKFAVIEQFFTVAEYVLPKFEVTVDLPPFLHININNPALQEDLKATVLAKYTYGKPVKGIANVLIKLDYRYWWYKEPQPMIKKALKLEDGKADISLTIKDLLSLLPSKSNIDTLRYQTIFVQANVTETLTGKVISSDNTVPMKSNLFKMEFVPSTPNNYKPGLNYEAYVRVLKIDGTPPYFCELITSSRAPKTVTVEITHNYPWRRENRILPKKEKFELDLDERGYVFIHFKTYSDVDSVNIRTSFFDHVSNSTIYSSKYLSRFETRDTAGIKLDLMNEDKIIKPRSRLTFEVKTVKAIKRFSLQIISKGNIMYTRYYRGSVAKTTFYKKVYISSRFVTKIAPEARFVVSYATASGELIADSMALNVVDYMINKIKLSFNKNVTKPGDDKVVLNVKTQRRSFVGLLGVDQSVLLLNKGNDITSNMVSNELVSYNNIYYNPGRPMPMGMRCFDCGFWPIWLGGKNTDTLLSNAGLFVLTNLYVKKREIMYYPMAMERGVMMEDVVMMAAPMALNLGSAASVSASTSPAQVRVRKDFPETFIWTDTTSDRYGRCRLKVKVPDTITSWVATGFSVSSSYGLGVSMDPAKLTVIKPFFISLNLPYSIIRGEEFALQANVFNYMGRNLEAEVKLLASKYFKVISCGDKSLKSIEVQKEIEVMNNDATAVYFWVVATSLGHIPIEVRAFVGVAADAIKATLLVKPEGQPQSYTASEFIQLEAEASFDSSFDVELPPKDVLVPGSVVIEVTVIGDIMGSALNGIEDLLKMPSGCGEQNLLSFAPDVYIMTYLQVSNQLTDVIKNKAVNFMTSGYQRQLTYQRNDGSFSAFGQSDKSGSTWLSAFTVKCFHQAMDFIPIEDAKIARTLNWVIKYQQEDGSFVEPPGGRVIHTNMQGGASSGIAMSAYVLISLLENKKNSKVNQKTLEDSIKKARSFLEASYTKYSKDPYALAIISYALFKAESSKLQPILEMLDKMAVTEGGLKHWKSKVEKPSDTWRSHYGQPKSYGVELASYVLLVHSQNNDLSKSLPIAKWLLTQRNAFGGFSSTQDTVLGLEALASFAALIAGPTKGQGITVSVGNDVEASNHTFDPITQSNALFLQSVQLPENTKKVSIKAKNEGAALVQLIVKYNVDSGDQNDLLSLKLSSKSAAKNLTLDVATSWRGEEVSGMVVVEVAILTGYNVVAEELIQKQIGGIFKKLEKSANKIVIYLDELAAKEVSFSIFLEELIPVCKVKPALVKVYRYYDSEYVASGFYSSTTVNTWQGSCPLCC